MKTAVAAAVLAAMVYATPARAADALAACGDIADSAARLACFDRELARSRLSTTPAPATVSPTASSLATPAAGAAVAPAAAVEAVAEVTPAAPPAAAASAEPGFGSEELPPQSRKAGPEAHAMHARISSQKEIGSSRIYNVFLDNGQVWRHENTHLGSYLREGEAVTIAQTGALGTYRLTRDAGKEKDWIKVTRVR